MRFNAVVMRIQGKPGRISVNRVEGWRTVVMRRTVISKIIIVAKGPDDLMEAVVHRYGHIVHPAMVRAHILY